MNYPETYKYTKEHEWVLVEGSAGTIGITHHAQHELRGHRFCRSTEGGFDREQRPDVWLSGIGKSGL